MTIKAKATLQGIQERLQRIHTAKLKAETASIGLKYGHNPGTGTWQTA